MVEPQIVILVVAGSSPVGHPTFLPFTSNETNLLGWCFANHYEASFVPFFNCLLYAAANVGGDSR